jgi:hypothetical protein
MANPLSNPLEAWAADLTNAIVTDLWPDAPDTEETAVRLMATRTRIFQIVMEKGIPGFAPPSSSVN